MKELEAIETIKRYAGLLPCARGEDKALDLAMQALEKQIPKKVNMRHIRKFDGFDDGECPSCGNSVIRDGFCIDVYCDNCGQKLDWSDES